MLALLSLLLGCDSGLESGETVYYPYRYSGTEPYQLRTAVVLEKSNPKNPCQDVDGWASDEKEDTGETTDCFVGIRVMDHDKFPSTAEYQCRANVFTSQYFAMEHAENNKKCE